MQCLSSTWLLKPRHLSRFVGNGWLLFINKAHHQRGLLSSPLLGHRRLLDTCSAERAEPRPQLWLSRGSVQLAQPRTTVQQRLDSGDPLSAPRPRGKSHSSPAADHRAGQRSLFMVRLSAHATGRLGRPGMRHGIVTENRVATSLLADDADRHVAELHAPTRWRIEHDRGVPLRGVNGDGASAATPPVTSARLRLSGTTTRRRNGSAVSLSSSEYLPFGRAALVLSACRGREHPPATGTPRERYPSHTMRPELSATARQTGTGGHALLLEGDASFTGFWQVKAASGHQFDV